MEFQPELLFRNLDEDINRLASPLKSLKGEILKKTITKKLVLSSSASVQLDLDARADFVRRNDELQKFVVPESLLVNTLALRMQQDLTSDWDGDVCTSYLLFSKLAKYGGTGPGAGISTPGDDFVSKLFTETISSTSSALYRYYLATLPANWGSALRHFPQKAVIVPGGVLSTVPKDATKNRTICKEPTVNMFFQQGARSQLESCLKNRYGIDLSNQQDKNRELARKGSIDGKLSTIDLTNASDCNTVQLMKRLLDRVSFSTLNSIRSPTFTDRGTVHTMNMVSTMGNAFTFPLMTILFSALCHVVAQFRSVKLDASNFGVFGDDIIVPTVIADDLLLALRHIGFQPNKGKSFTTGFFRESCGGDFLHGCDVRGIYLKRMKNEQDVYSAFNRLHRWSLLHDISLHCTLRYLRSLAKFRPVPRHESVDAGFIIGSGHLQSPKRDNNGSLKYWACTVASRQRKVGDGTYNPLGAKIASIGGYVRDQRIGIRSKSPKPIVVKRITPCWDYSNDTVLIGRVLDDSWNQLLS